MNGASLPRANKAAPPTLALAKGVEIEPDRIEAAAFQEAAVIGLLLQQRELMRDCGGLEPEHFVIDQYRRAFAAMRAAGPGITARGITDAAGVPIQLLLRASASAPSRIVFTDHVGEIRRAAVIRDMLASARAISAAGAGADAGALAAMLRRAAERAEAAEDGRLELDGTGLAATLLEHIDGVREGRTSAGVTTGFQPLDQLIGGYRPGELIIVAARPGMGKTIFMTASARLSALAGPWSIGTFSLEVKAEQYAARLIADQIRDGGHTVPFNVFLHSRLRPETDEWVARAAHEVAGLGLYTAFKSGIDVGEIEATIERWRERAARRQRPLAVVFIDYLKFIKSGERYRGNRVLEIGEVTAGLRQIGQRHGLCIVLLTQLNRGVETREDKRPMLADLRDSGEIEQDADAVLMLYREAYYLRRAKSPEELARHDLVRNEVEILIEKNRAGETGTVKLWCDVSTASMRAWAREDT